jgi:hypothetical protein
MSEERLTRIEQRLDLIATDVAVLKTDVAELKTNVAGLKTDGAGLRNEVVDLRRHMLVLHEETMDRLKAMGEDDSIRREMRAGFADLRRLIADHAIPGDAADRSFTATLDDHERRIRALEQG